MNEYEVPPWLLKAAQEANAYVRQMAPMLKAAGEANAMIQPYLPLLRDAQKHMDDLRAAMAIAGSARPPPELVQVMNAGLRELFLSRQQRDVSVLGPVATVSVAAPAGSVVVSDAGQRRTP